MANHHDHDEHPQDLNLLEEMNYETRDFDVDQAPKGTVWFFGVTTGFFILAFISLIFMGPDFIPWFREGKFQTANQPHGQQGHGGPSQEGSRQTGHLRLGEQGEDRRQDSGGRSHEYGRLSRQVAALGSHHAGPDRHG
jgi:hypothetical protein